MRYVTAPPLAGALQLKPTELVVVDVTERFCGEDGGGVTGVFVVVTAVESPRLVRATTSKV